MTAVAEGVVHERICHGAEVFFGLDQSPYLLLADLVGQAIAAQEQTIAGIGWVKYSVNVNRRANSNCTRENASMWMLDDLILGEFALPNEFRSNGVIARQPLQGARPKHVRTAIADIDGRELPAGCHTDRTQRRAHARESLIRGRALKHSGVGRPYRRRELIEGSSREGRLHYCYRETRSCLSSGEPAHPISHGDKVVETDDPVLVILSDSTDVST